jgi:hypothetical protein
MLWEFSYLALGCTKSSTNITPVLLGEFCSERKYHWVRWDAVCKPKSLGALGIVDTKLTNTCLMAKWI